MVYDGRVVRVLKSATFDAWMTGLADGRARARIEAVSAGCRSATQVT